MKIIRKYITSTLTPMIVFAFITTIIIWYHTIKIKKLEKEITVLREDISHICDAGMKTVEGLVNNQDGLIEAFKEIQKLKQTQKGMTYH